MGDGSLRLPGLPCLVVAQRLHLHQATVEVGGSTCHVRGALTPCEYNWPTQLAGEAIELLAVLDAILVVLFDITEVRRLAKVGEPGLQKRAQTPQRYSRSQIPNLRVHLKVPVCAQGLRTSSLASSGEAEASRSLHSKIIFRGAP